MYYTYSSSIALTEGKWNEKTCVLAQGGLMVDKTTLVTGTEFIPKGTPIAIVTGKAVPVRTVKVQANAAANATSLLIMPGDGAKLKVGDTVAGSAISEITLGTTYDTLTVAALAAKVDKDTIVCANGIESSVAGLCYASVEVDDAPSLTITIQAYEIEESTLPVLLNPAIKTALTSRHQFI